MGMESCSLCFWMTNATTLRHLNIYKGMFQLSRYLVKVKRQEKIASLFPNKSQVKRKMQGRVLKQNTT
jgi:hypothetical protein